MPGEAASPTQPVPTAPPPFARQKFTVADLDPYILSPRDRRCDGKPYVEGAINEGLFTPPEQQDTVEMPGNRGGSNWGMTASNPDSGAMFVVSMDMPAILKDERRAPPSLWNIPTSGTPAQQGKAVYHFYCERCHGADHEGAPPAIPSLVECSCEFRGRDDKSVVKYGLKDMPGFPDLTDRFLDGLMLIPGQSGKRSWSTSARRRTCRQAHTPPGESPPFATGLATVCSPQS